MKKLIIILSLFYFNNIGIDKVITYCDDLYSACYKFLSHPAIEGIRHKAYPDGHGKLTIGIGCTENVTPEMVITDAQIEARFRAALLEAINKVNKTIDVNFPINKQVVLVSQAFNLQSYQHLILHLNESEEIYKKKILEYCRDAGGIIERGLLKRRIYERLLWEGKDWTSLTAKLDQMSVPQIQNEMKILFAA